MREAEQGLGRLAQPDVPLRHRLLTERGQEIPVPVEHGQGVLPSQLEPLPNDVALTVGGELNKLASNVATGRNQAGVHWRTDGIESLRLGEAVAIELLKEHKETFNEGGRFVFTSFDGQPVVI